MSLSPERFLSLHGHHVETSPIKGTRPRYDDQRADQLAAQELRSSEKDRAENLMIVDLLRNDLGRSCVPGSIHVDRLFEVQSFPTVHHLVSTISGELRQDRGACELLRDSFPGGSITGAPKRRAMEIIAELEPTHGRPIAARSSISVPMVAWTAISPFARCCVTVEKSVAGAAAALSPTPSGSRSTRKPTTRWANFSVHWKAFPNPEVLQPR